MTPPSGRLVVERPEPGWRDRLRSYAIEVDGQRRGRVKLGRVLIVDVPPGRHRIQARIDWTGSEPIDIDVAAGVDVHVIVETTGTAFEFWQAFTRSGYLCLRLV